MDTLELLAAIHGLQSEVLADDPSVPEVAQRLLDTLLQLTGSEYGFIGARYVEADGTPYLKTHAITDISWDAASRALYDVQLAGGLEFRNLDSLFGVTVRGDGPVLSNEPADDLRAGGLPSGHPRLRNYLGLPIERHGELLGMVGIANRPGGFDATMIDALAPFCSTCASVLQAWRIQDERQQLEARIAHGERLASLGLLASRVAHDLNNALMGIKGRTHVARRRGAQGIDKELDGIEDAVDRMGELTRELLTFAGGHEHRSEQLELGRLVDDVRVLLELALPRDAELAVRKDGPAPVLGDPAPLRQVLMNFVTNAAEAMDGSGLVELYTGIDEADAWLRDAFVLGDPPLGPCSVAVVRDHGPGVPAALLETIFDPFVTGKPDGRGLGLAGVPGIVARHDGCVAVRNMPDGGACFALLLPLATLEPDGPLAGRADVGARVTARNTRVVVLESDPAVRQVTCRVLEEQDWRPVGCERMEELLDVVAEAPPGAVVLDASGHLAGGERQLRRLRDAAGDVPVVITTGFADLDIAGAVRHDPAVVVLPKPYGGAELAEALTRVLAGRER